MRHLGFTAAATGVALVVFYTGLISSADAITKVVAGKFAAPQLFALSGLIAVVLSLVMARVSGGDGRVWQTAMPRTLALRCAMTLVATLCYFHAFRLLPFAEVFAFIALVPIFAGLLSDPVLGEKVRPVVWSALALGAGGVITLFPGGWSAFQPGHGIALLASFTGALSMVLARRIGRVEAKALTQVLYPQLGLACCMALALPFVWRPMGAGDIALVLGYAGLLFVARWVLVLALSRLRAFVATPLMNLQFVWMVILGGAVFGEVPGSRLYIGVAIIVISGILLVIDELAEATRKVNKAAAVPAE